MSAWFVLQALATGLALVAIAAYIVVLLPRLPRQRSLWISGLIAAASLLAALAWPAAALVAVAVLFGHAGWGAAHWHSAKHDVDTAFFYSDGASASSTPRDSAPPTRPSLDTPSRTPPTLLGRYRIEAQIGRGSMGAVYLGHDPQIGRQVAIKTLALSREFSGDKLVEARERFFREAETAGRLQHPDIVTIFDVGEANELAYIAMEFVNGHDLQMYATPQRRMPLAQMLALTARLADALAYAHSQGVVHRDIKPANVMVDEATGLVKVMDFGVARIADASRTRTGLVLGTPSYMSPEQIAGRPVDGRSDLYSLGVMLFELLTGQLPHRGEPMSRLMFQIANEAAPDVRTLRPDVPEALANVVALALEKRLEVRYADGRQMAADLRAVAAQIETTGSGGAAAHADDFEKTVTFSPAEPRHNPGP